MLKPGTASTFSDNASQVFLPCITAQLQSMQRVDVVWDEFVHGNLKAYTRSTRGKGSRTRVESSNNMPTNWKGFLRNNDNKTELFSFLSLETATIETEKQIIITHHKDILCTQPRNTVGLAHCTQEEADTRIFLHVSDAANHGYSKVMIRTDDSDVLVLAIAAVNEIHIGLLLPQLKASDTSQLMRLHCPLFQKSPIPYSSYMHSADVILCWSWKEDSMGNLEDM